MMGRVVGIRLRGDGSPLLLLAVGQLISWGTLYYGLTFLAQPIQHDTTWSLTQIFGAFSGGLLAAALCAPLIGEFIARWGGRICLTAGSLLAAVALTVIALSSTFAIFTVGWVLAGVAMAATLYEAAFSALRETSGDAFRQQVSALALISGLASTLVWPLASALVAIADWRAAFLCFAALQAGIAAPVHWWLPCGRPEQEPQPTCEPAPPPSPESGKSTSALWWLASSFALAALLSSALSAHLAVILARQGVGDTLALWTAVLIGPMQVIARATDMALHGTYSLRLLGLLALGLPPMGIALLLVAPHWPLAALLFALLYGTGHGLVTIFKALAPTMLGHGMAYPRLAGWIAAPGLLTRALAPALTALMITATDVRVTLLALIGTGVISAGLLMAFFWRRQESATQGSG